MQVLIIHQHLTVFLAWAAFGEGGEGNPDTYGLIEKICNFLGTYQESCALTASAAQKPVTKVASPLFPLSVQCIELVYQNLVYWTTILLNWYTKKSTDV